MIIASEKVLKAFEYLEKKIKEEIEYPEAQYRAAVKFKLNEVEVEELADLYDDQF